MGGNGMSEANVNDPFSVVATEAEVQAARRRPLKIVDPFEEEL